ncbi:galactofuranosyltransferase lpg1-like protein [Leptomonas seymouri]|uniref:Galactofuranosyltransferase lpg1-like protein n=1 Tax=Leptomonas seymouri TaxID=5684 RepID=A0A0N1IJD9_LEPSE|nr:galactofuranosyltransferase lpg1-like protein [Leptomonas seymouri]|eukprot:KPI85055.1 galactofuranosyltransferase lpg1-like protein [Leptomonas seymouri]
MYRSGGRRLLRRSSRRGHLFAFVAVATLLLIFFLMPSTAPTEITSAADQRQWPTPHPPVPTAVQAEITLSPPNGGERGEHQQPGHPTGGQEGAGREGDVQKSATNADRDADGLYQLYPQELRELEALDLFKPRAGETKVSFVRFASCLAAMLAVEPVNRTEMPRTDPANTQQLPFLVSVTAGNTQDLKAMICNLSVSYKYIVLAQTGDTPEMTPFFDLLIRVFRFTQRLVVLQFKESIGFAGALNAGLREALRHPFDEVPFVHVVHNDVRYLRTALATSITDAYLDFQRDKEVIERLEAEVKTEPNEHTPLIRRPHGLRAPLSPNNPLPQLNSKPSVLVTSALLPDRLRYMDVKQRQKQFEGHTSFVFHNSRSEYTAVYLSRLAVLTVGFFDENFYPVMFDDTDFRWRAAMLGFSEIRLADFDNDAIAFDVDCTNAKVDGEHEGPPQPTRLLPVGRAQRAVPADGKLQLSPVTKALLRECATAFNLAVQFHYMSAKWGTKNFLELAQGRTELQPYASETFSGKKHLPLDAWVVDTRRIAEVKKALRDTGAGGLEIMPYNAEVILRALE